MNKIFIRFISALFLSYILHNTAQAQNEISSIAFGSCLKQNKPAPILNSIAAENPDIFIFTGDSIYADTIDKRVMRKKYKQLSKKPEFQSLKNNVPIYATWDDHDYGRDNAGANFSFKKQSQQIFLDFFEVPENGPQRKRDGVFSVEYFGDKNRRVQIVLLDTRFFRDPPKRGSKSETCPNNLYVPHDDTDTTILGSYQWAWLQKQLKEPARVRIIVSSIQVIPKEHCFEKWANFPHQRERLFQLIRKTNANGVIFISGDRHLAEISLLANSVVPYPLFEVTSSGLNTAEKRNIKEINSYRTTAENFREDNYGSIKIDWGRSDPIISLEIRDALSNVVIEQSVLLSTLH